MKSTVVAGEIVCEECDEELTTCEDCGKDFEYGAIVYCEEDKYDEPLHLCKKCYRQSQREDE